MHLFMLYESKPTGEYIGFLSVSVSGKKDRILWCGVGLYSLYDSKMIKCPHGPEVTSSTRTPDHGLDRAVVTQYRGGPLALGS